jgi:putative acetyltransferase
MAVLPERQRSGIGSALVGRGLDECRARGERIVIVVGHPEYYPRFGFSDVLARPLRSAYSGGRAWMAIELEPGALGQVEGDVKYPPAFDVVS